MKIEDRMARHDDRLRVDIPVSNGDCRGERATFFVSRFNPITLRKAKIAHILAFLSAIGLRCL